MGDTVRRSRCRRRGLFRASKIATLVVSLSNQTIVIVDFKNFRRRPDVIRYKVLVSFVGPKRVSRGSETVSTWCRTCLALSARLPWRACDGYSVGVFGLD